jgi:hypothetical protein
MYKSFGLHPFIQRLRAHPGFSSADRELIAEAEAAIASGKPREAVLQRLQQLLGQSAQPAR